MHKADKTAAGVVVGIAAGAFALSYEALRFVYLGTNGHARLGYVYPLIVEGFVTVAVWVAYRLRDWGWKATAYPWTLAALFFAYSLWANSLPDSVPAPVVKGMPSVAVPLAVHLFTHMVKRRTAPMVELVDDDHQDHEEPLREDPWDPWEPPAVEKAQEGPQGLFEAPRPPAMAASTSSESATPLIRAWAKTNGYEVKETGRIPDAVIQAFAKAQGGKLIGA